MSRRALRILAFSDEVSLMAPQARLILKGHEYQVFDDTDVTKRLAMMQQVHGVAMDVATDESIDETIVSRHRLGFRYDLFSIYTLRVWQIGMSLRRMVDSIRKTEGTDSDGIRFASLPVAVMNPLNMVQWDDSERAKDFQNLANQPEVYVAKDGEPFPRLAARATGTWWLNAIQSLLYCGAGITIDPSGRLEVCGAYGRPHKDSSYFQSDTPVTPLATRYWGFRCCAREAEEAIYALDEALNRAAGATPKDQEPILQSCLQRYPELLAMGIYDTVVPQIALKSPDPFGISIRPDFLALNTVIPGIEHASAVIEIKSSEMRLATTRAAARKFREAIDQIGNGYRRYFADQRTRQIQTDRLGRYLEDPRLMLVIGRSAWADEWMQIRQDQRSSEHSDMTIVSYDDLSYFSALRLETMRSLSNTIAEGIA